ncbi:MAG: glycosyltransferase [Balneolaceae bacterium]
MIHTIQLVANLDNKFGGPAKSVPSLSNSLRKYEVGVDLVSSKLYKLEENDFINRYGLQERWYSFESKFIKRFGYAPKMLSKISSLSQQTKSNTIIHIHSLWKYCAYCGKVVAKKNNLPIVISPRSSLYGESLKRGKFQKKVAKLFFVNQLLNKSSCIHVTSKFEMNEVRKQGIKNPIAIISNGIDTTEFQNLRTKKQAKHSLGIPDYNNVVLFLSRVNERKRLEQLIKCFNHSYKNNPDWCLLIVGPHEQPYFDNQIKPLLKEIPQEIREKIYITGNLSGRRRLDAFAASSLFVLPTKFENFGMAIGEAMAAGLPVLTTDMTPWLDLQGINAGITISSDLGDLQDAFNSLISKSNEELKVMGLSGQKYIEENYSWNRIAKQMKDVYAWILNKKDQPDFVYLNQEK